MYFERRTRVRFFLAFWLFVLSGVAFLDRTNISIAGLQIGAEYGLGNQRLGWIFSAFGAHGVSGVNLYSIMVAVIGAVVVLTVYHALRRPA